MTDKGLNPTHVEFPIEPITQNGHPVSPQQIEVVVDGPQQVKAQFKEHNNKVIVYFTTTTPGKYTVNLKHRGVHLKLSPLVVDVTVKDENGVDLPPPSLPDIPKHDVEFEVDAVDENGSVIPHDGEVSVECEGPARVHPVSERRGEKIYITFSTYVSEGSFSVSVRYKGAHIQRSPFDIQLSPIDTHEESEYEITKKGKVATLDPLPPHREVQFTVPCRLRDGSYTKAHDCVGAVIVGEDGKVDLRIEDDPSQHNSIKISFNALKSGKHKILIALKGSGQEIAGSPFSINVPPEAFLRR